MLSKHCPRLKLKALHDHFIYVALPVILIGIDECGEYLSFSSNKTENNQTVSSLSQILSQITLKKLQSKQCIFHQLKLER